LINLNNDVSPETIVFSWLLYHPVKAVSISESKHVERLKNALETLNVKLAHDEWYEVYAASGQKILR